jgi:hypothetical protein
MLAKQEEFHVAIDHLDQFTRKKPKPKVLSAICSLHRHKLNRALIEKMMARFDWNVTTTHSQTSV